MWNEDRRLTGQETLIEDKMYPLARRNYRLRIGIIQSKDAVGKDAGCIDDYSGGNFKGLPPQLVSGHNAGDATIGFDQFFDTAVVYEDSTLGGGCLREADRQSRVVELPVVIKHSAPQAVGIQRRGKLKNLFP